MTADSPAPGKLPALDLPIHILRQEGRLELGTGEIFVGPLNPSDPRPRVVEWRVEGGLMPDEMVLVFGRPLDWTGPVCEEDPNLPLVESCFDGGPIALTRRHPVARTGEPRTGVFDGAGSRIGWCFGVVLLRGEDSPWYAQSRLTLHHLKSS
jgi:hypothetical protein